MPSSHSHSSHSSHSSSSHSSSHSHSSHSSYSSSSSRSYSSPSSHSTTSYSKSAMAAINRKTVADKKYEAVKIKPKEIITGTDHTYRYFNTTWEDGNNTSHKPGYYDEDNNRYDGVYTPYNEVVLCHCEYCGNTSTFSTRNAKEFECESCGAPLNVIVIKQESDLHTYDAKNSSGGIFPVVVDTIIVSIIIFIFACLPCRFVKTATNYVNDTRNVSYEDSQIAETLYLTPTGINNSYTYSGTITDDYTIALRWDGENYYDNTNDYYIWYNTEVSPAMWQYWQENISGDFGDYGWMEFDETTKQWFIEKSEGNWIEVPEKYDTSDLYYLVK